MAVNGCVRGKMSSVLSTVHSIYTISLSLGGARVSMFILARDSARLLTSMVINVEISLNTTIPAMYNESCSCDIQCSAVLHLFLSLSLSLSVCVCVCV